MATPIKVFEDNIADADRLVRFAGPIANMRLRRSRNLDDPRSLRPAI